MKPPIEARDQYHVAMVVEDLTDSMARLTAAVGYHWTIPVGKTRTIRTPERDMEVTPRIVFTIEAPHIELVTAMPGTVWELDSGRPLHHVGYFVDDLEAASAALERAGFHREAWGIDGDGGLSSFAYHLDRTGARLEIVDRALFGDWPAFLRRNAAPTNPGVA